MDLQPESDTDGGSRNAVLAFAGLFALVAVLVLSDLILDARAGTTPAHLGVEGTIVLACLAGFALALRRFAALRRLARAAKHDAVVLGQRLAAVQREAERWRSEARDLLQGLGAAIERQLVRWDLTPAEREVALLLLKGLSHREIAAMRNVGEATVRQQARGIYRKAGVDGRHDLAAFFLEGILAPGDGPPAA
ncbi:MAG: response regulator transcription factor [Planctomycetes bacterium]|nr:response regulator transcription factor [Planctomycetota bacterium]